MNKKFLRILWSSNSPWTNSGYAMQSDMITKRIAKDGYPIGFVAFYGLEGGKIEKDGIIFYPKTASAYGEDAVVDHSRDFKPDVTITFQDLETLNPEALSHFVRWIPMTPVDTDPVSPFILDRARGAYRVISISTFGQEQFRTKGVFSTYLPCMVDTNVFKPMRNREDMRKTLAIPDDIFLFGMIGANKEWPPRKSYQEAMDAFKIFHDTHPKSGMYFHTNYLQGHVFPIEEYARFIGIQDVCYKTPPYNMMFQVERQDVASIMNAFDCQLAPSSNEGFGVPIIEAQACGIPVITNHFSATTELVKHKETGYVAETAYKVFTPKLGYIGIPSVPDIVEGMNYIFENKDALGKAARAFALENYDTDMIYATKWRPFLEKLEMEIYPTTQ